ncbi:phage tail protein [Streptococcus mutans]|uniref:tape measure protein n=1 Tax=Streptococcus mutans TaxID=1309 RepID=UPI0014550E60|nr:tape measure protein [Streptococcus mutans]NLQ88505.1 phage tail protein [Streptococcus mutans]
MATISNVMSTKIALDTVEAQSSIRGLTQAVSSMISAWKAQEAQLRESGNYLQAAEAKYEGLGRSIEAQKSKIEALKREQEELSKGTQANSEKYLKYENQINQATAKLTSLETQQRKAKESMDYQKSGLADLQSEYRKNNELSQSLVQRLTAEGKERSALKEQYRQSKENIESLNTQYTKQVQELEKIRKASGETSEAFHNQQKRVNATATSLANAKKDADGFNKELKQTDPSLFGRLKKKISETNDELKKTSKINSRTWDFVKGNIIANGISNIGNKIKDVATKGFELAKASNETKERLTALGYTKQQISILSYAMSDLKMNTALSGATAKSLTERFMSMTGSASKTQAIVKGFGVLANDLKLNDEQANNLSGSFTRIYSAGKLSAGVLAKMEKSTPGVTSAFAKMAGTTTENFKKMVEDGKITSDKFNELMSNNSKRFLASGQEYKTSTRGIVDYLKKSWQGLEKSFATPIFETAQKSLGKLTQQFDPQIFDRLGTSLGKISAKGLEAVSNVFEYLLKNRKEIGGISSSVISIAKAFGEGVWDTAKTVINGISDGFNAIFKHSKSAQKPIKTLSDGMKEVASHKEAIKTIGVIFASYFVGTKVVSGIGALVRGLYRIPTAFNAIKLAMNTNPFGIALTAITTVGVALTVLYKKNKKFRDWVNKTAKGIAEFFKPVVDFIGNVGKAVGGAISSVVKFNKETGLISKTLQVAFAPLKLIGALVVLPFKIALSALDGFNKHGLGGLIKGAGKALGSFGKFSAGVIKGAASMAAKAGKSIGGFVSGALKGVGKFAGGVGKTVGKGFSGMQKLVSKAFGGSQKEAKKQTSKMSKQTQKDIQKMIKNTQKQLQTLQKSSKKTFADLPKNAQKAFKNAEKQIKAGQRAINKVMKSVDRQLKSFDKNYKKIFDAFAKTAKTKTDGAFKQTKVSISKIQKLVNSGGKWYKTLEKNTSKLQKTTDNLLNRIQKDFEATWNRIANHVINRLRNMQSSTDSIFGKTIKNAIFNSNNQIKSNFKSTFDNVSSNYSNFWKSMKNSTGRGINSMIDVLNQGVNSINSLISSFGGSKNAIKTISPAKYASGTGFFNSFRRPIDKPTYAMLNDGNDSPETDNRELVIMPNGQAFMPKERNFKTILPAGTEVLNAKETAELFGQAMPYASGTGFFPSLVEAIKHGSYPWFGKTIKQDEDSDAKKKAKEFIEKASSGSGIDKEIPKSVKGLAGSFSTIINGMVKKVFDPGEKHWSTMWTMAKEAMEEAGSSVAMGAKGDDYRFKDRAKDSGADPWGYFFRECVSFVASRLANLGVNPGLFSHLGNGNQWGAARVPHLSRPKPGTVAVYTGGPVSSNHVSFVTATHGDTMDGEEYNWMGNGQYHQYNNRPISSASTYLDFGVKSGSDSKDGGAKADVKADSPLRKLIKGQVGKMFDWIKEHLADPESGGEDNVQGSGVERWRSSVVKALKANGIDPTAFRVSKILSTIQRESNGDPNVQNNWDSNAAAGHPSIGLMQTIQPTFDAYAHSGHHNIRNGYDNLLAAINYIKHRYGTDDAAFNRVAAYGYVNGGKVSKEGLYPLAEGGMAEYIIPTDKAKRNRGWKLVKDIVSEFTDDDPDKIKRKKTDDDNNDNKIDKLLKKVDNMVSLLAALVAGQSKSVVADVNLDGKSFAEALAKYSTKANNDYSKREQLLNGLI